MSSLADDLVACACCAGTSVETPARIENRAGLSAIAYRVGTHARFRHSLIARLSSVDHRVLGALRTREQQDFTIALLDSWAMVCDVLTFYQERIANEAFLRTATERRSLLELSRLIGYELKPGVAASTWLAFALEDSIGAAEQATRRMIVDTGTRVQSIPAPGEQPQVYESVEKIEARVAWNSMRPRLVRRQPIVADTNKPLLFAGLATGLKVGDGLFLSPDQGTALFRQVAAVTLQPAQQQTAVELEPLSRNESPIHGVAQGGIFEGATAKVATAASITTSLMAQGTVASSTLHATALSGRFVESNVFANLYAVRPQPPGVLAFRVRAALFGHNAPRWDTLTLSQRYGELLRTGTEPDEASFVNGAFRDRQNNWAEAALNTYWDIDTKDDGFVCLDSSYPGIRTDSRVVLRQGHIAQLYAVDRVSEVSKADFGISAKVTRLQLSSSSRMDTFTIRNTTVHGGSEQLPLAPIPIEEPVAGTNIDLEGWVEGLYVGQSIVVCGELSTMTGVRACEHATLLSVTHDMKADGGTSVMVSGLVNSYVRETVTIFGNVARASHGESVREVLGSGVAAESFQAFTLKQPPLTHVKSANPRGAESTLTVRVNDLLWHETPTLFGRGPLERVFITRLDDDGATQVRFGDGITGARLPTGAQNLRAEYRKGIGLGGIVRAGQLSMLLTRPLGVKGVTNPLDAEGAADPESLGDSRRNAPLTVLTLDRIVSLRDYEDFARAFAGVDKAMASWSLHRGSRGILLTVAGSEGAEIRRDSLTYESLVAAIRGAGDPFVPIRVVSYLPAFFRVSGGVVLDGDFQSDKVLAAVEAALRDRFGFEARSFGQPVTLSEVIAAIQAVEGVVAVDLDSLQRVGDTGGALPARLTASMPGMGASGDGAAELLMLAPGPIDLRVLP